jgi:hypothetical protein
MKKKLLTKISSSFFLLIAVFAHAQTVYPYLQSATSSSVYISWKTNANKQSLVEYGTSSTTLTNSANGTTQVLSDVGYPGNYFYHTVKLSHLNPNTIYYYKVTTGTFASAVSSFKTLPLPGNAATADGHIRFLVMGDNELTENRFDTLMVRAKRKCEQKYTGAINENISTILMMGDQVNEGTLASYENVHFAKSKYLSPVIPIQTTVGENETNGTLKLAAYDSLFYYDSLNYKGIYSGTENYYAYQIGNVLLINLSTEHVSNVQFSWLQKVVTAANTDATVHWIFSMGHRPYQAEQYIGDISPWIRNTVVPYLTSSPKFIMHLGGHHHLYARGQLKDNPVYNVISGGTAYDQFWAMSQEQDMDDVQKTIPNWAYNIVDVDVINDKIEVETYSIGSKFALKNNVLIDQFHRYKNKPVPVKPSFTNTFGDSLQLPYTITGSAFSSPAGEFLNSTEFQISSAKTFATLQKGVYRDYEDLFGYVVKADSSADVNAGVNILNLKLDQWSIPNGKYYVRLRYRDRNLEWSPWSVTDSFKVVKSVAGTTTLVTNKKSLELSDSVKVTYANGPGQVKDWIGLFKAGDVPGAGTTIQRQYTTGSNGSLLFKNIVATGQYYVAFFTNDTYTELAPRFPVFFGSIPVVTTNKPDYLVGDTVTLNYTHAPALSKDWVGVYKVGTSLAGIDPQNWDYVTGASGNLKIPNLGKGYYFASYFLEDGYMEPGERAYFTIEEKAVDTISNLLLNKSVYKLGESINASWTDAPGLAKDELIIYTVGSTPGTSTPVSSMYTGSVANGTFIISNGRLPQATGNYFISLYTNDVFKEISNRVNFTVIDSVVTTIHAFESEANTINIYPNPISKNGGAIIESESLIQKVEFMDITGRVLFASQHVNSKTFPIMNMDLPAGIYYVKVYQEGEKVKTGKIVISE